MIPSISHKYLNCNYTVGKLSFLFCNQDNEYRKHVKIRKLKNNACYNSRCKSGGGKGDACSC